MKLGNRIIRLLSLIAFLAVIVMIMVGVWGKAIPGEAYIGDFQTHDLNDGWELSVGQESRGRISLPYVVPGGAFKQVTISHPVPDSVENGVRLTIHTNFSRVRIYIDNELRVSYGYGKILEMTQYSPEAYVGVNLYKNDLGKTIYIKYELTDVAALNTITYGYGNNAWFEIIRHNIMSVIISVLMIIVGFGTMIGDVLTRRFLRANKSGFIMGQLMVIVGIWVISASKLRQIIFGFSGISAILPYLALEIMAVFILRYFDEVQSQYYHKAYLGMETAMLLQIFVNIILQKFNIMPFHETITFSHFWILLGVVFSIGTIINDVAKNRIRKYKIAAVGIITFLILFLAEIGAYYFIPFHNMGVLTSIGLSALLVATVTQTIRYAFLREITRNEKMKSDNLTTIETIAASIDAKDEYTGGHSERVAYYANILAREVAEEYGLTEDDILKINYNALLHDIGKIGIPDTILNKAGQLSYDEYQLIKRHTVIGDSLIHGSENIEYLSDGIRYHHERPDGRGYPDGLKGDEIPLVARILNIADSFDAMTSNRVYRSHFTMEKVRAEIERCAGTQFDPQLAQVFCRLIEEGKISPQTKEGLDTNSDGIIRKSSLLRQLLTDNIIEGRRRIINPQFVTMVSYIVKINEIEGRNIRMFLIGVKGIDKEDLDGEKLAESKKYIQEYIDQYMQKYDINIDYSTLKRLVIWVGREDRKVDEIIRSINKKQTDGFKITVEEII